MKKNVTTLVLSLLLSAAIWLFFNYIFPEALLSAVETATIVGIAFAFVLVGRFLYARVSTKGRGK